MTKAARALRAGLDVSPAHAIEARRLANAIAALRDVPLPGLPEADNAIREVFAFGSALAAALLHDRLIIAERLGSTPDDVPPVPLTAYVAAEQKRLRLAPLLMLRELDLDLDLRKPGDLVRSRSLHCLTLLRVAWGVRATSSDRCLTRPRLSIDVLAARVAGRLRRVQ